MTISLPKKSWLKKEVKIKKSDFSLLFGGMLLFYEGYKTFICIYWFPDMPYMLGDLVLGCLGTLFILHFLVQK